MKMVLFAVMVAAMVPVLAHAATLWVRVARGEGTLAEQPGLLPGTVCGLLGLVWTVAVLALTGAW